jgi:histidinol-phosphate/aromatic aminotransferase/cobyric acid decarboxylase-like protein
MKKQKKGKGKAGTSPAPRARKARTQTSPHVIRITSSPAPHSEIRSQVRPPNGPLSAAAAKCQELYVAHTSDSAGRIQLDRENLAQALSELGLSSLAEQALYSLALMAADDGYAVLFEADVIAALERSETATTLTQKAS